MTTQEQEQAGLVCSAVEFWCRTARRAANELRGQARPFRDAITSGRHDAVFVYNCERYDELTFWVFNYSVAVHCIGTIAKRQLGPGDHRITGLKTDLDAAVFVRDVSMHPEDYAFDKGRNRAQMDAGWGGHRRRLFLDQDTAGLDLSAGIERHLIRVDGIEERLAELTDAVREDTGFYR